METQQGTRFRQAVTQGPYVPQVGHLVKRNEDPVIYIVTWVNSPYYEIQSYKYGKVYFDIEAKDLVFLADRSAEWEALFQLPNQPTT